MSKINMFNTIMHRALTDISPDLMFEYENEGLTISFLIENANLKTTHRVYMRTISLTKTENGEEKLSIIPKSFKVVLFNMNGLLSEIRTCYEAYAGSSFDNTDPTEMVDRIVPVVT